MSCTITAGRVEPCKDRLGGIYRVYIGNAGALTGLTKSATDDSLSGTATGTLYEFDLKGISTFTQSIVSSKDNGTTVCTQTLTLSLKGMSGLTNKEITALAHGRPQIIICDNNGNSWVGGYEYGFDVTGGEAATGAAFADANGYTITLEAMERTFANYVDGSTIALPLGNITEMA